MEVNIYLHNDLLNDDERERERKSLTKSKFISVKSFAFFFSNKKKKLKKHGYFFSKMFNVQLFLWHAGVEIFLYFIIVSRFLFHWDGRENFCRQNSYFYVWREDSNHRFVELNTNTSEARKSFSHFFLRLASAALCQVEKISSSVSTQNSDV